MLTKQEEAASYSQFWPSVERVLVIDHSIGTFPCVAPPAACPKAHQAAQGLHLGHVRLDLVRAHRRHH